MTFEVRPFLPEMLPTTVPTQKARFSCTPFKTALELRALCKRARVLHVVLWVDGEWPANSWPTSGARLGAPVAVDLYVCRPEGDWAAARFEASTFDHWSDNLRAITRTLTGIYATGRYGVEKTNVPILPNSRRI